MPFFKGSSTIGTMYNEDIKAYIKRLFSVELQRDGSIAAEMERNQLRKWILDWATNPHEETIQKIQLDIKEKKTREYVQTGGGWARKE